MDSEISISLNRDSMAITSVKVSNVSLGASERDIKDFFSFSGEIEHVEFISDNEQCQIAYVSFKDAQGAETSVLLSGAIIVNQPITVELAPGYSPPAAVSAVSSKGTKNKAASGSDPTVQKAEGVVSSMLAKGFILGKDMLCKAKEFDNKHRSTSTTTSKVSSMNQKIGFSKKVSGGTTMVNGKMKEMDEKFQVSEKIKSTSNGVMKNRYVLTGATWAAGAFNRVSKKAGNVGEKTKEKVFVDEEKA